MTPAITVLVAFWIGLALGWFVGAGVKVRRKHRNAWRVPTVDSFFVGNAAGRSLERYPRLRKPLDPQWDPERKQP